MSKIDSLFSLVEQIVFQNKIPLVFEDSKNNFNCKWASPNNYMAEGCIQAQSQSYVPISNDPESIGTQVFDLNKVVGIINSTTSSTMSIKDLRLALAVIGNSIYEDLGFKEHFTICVYLVFQSLSNGQFSGIPKLKDVLNLFEPDGVTEKTLSPITPFNYNNDNIIPIAYVQMKNSEDFKLPSEELILNFTSIGSPLKYVVEQNNNSLPISGGLYLFATKFQTIVQLPNLKNYKETMTQEVRDAMNSVNEYLDREEDRYFEEQGETDIDEGDYQLRDVYSPNENEEMLDEQKQEIPSPSMSRETLKMKQQQQQKQAPSYESNFLETTKFLSFSSDCIIKQ